MVLTAKTKRQYRDRLTQEHERIQADLVSMEKEVVTLGEAQQVEGSVGNHLADDATDVMEQERNLALIGNLQERQRDVEHALERLEAGTYGSCERCGKPIAPERLEALPFATLCIDCKALDDQQRRPAML